MSHLPTGIVTFLFTDVEGSTTLWERHPEAMQTAMARHDEMIERLVAGNAGVVVRPRGEGDSRFAVFARATDAVAAAASIQRALGEETWPTPSPLKVRMALHTGEADVRAGDYYGSAVNRCARLRSAAHGGQTIVSLPTYELARDGLPDGLSFVDLGQHRLKDLIRPERIFQLVRTGQPVEFPPLRTLDARPNNLPLQPTALLGRERELEDVCRLLAADDVRLLTLTGPGGTGKTRLALQAAAEMLNTFDDGVYFVPLATVTDPLLVAAEIGRVLGIEEEGDRSISETLKGYLSERRLLLLLDNFEQVVDAAPLVAELLRTCAGLEVLLTSRSAVRLSAEREYPVPPLSVPNPRQLPALDRLSQYEAVRLFIERAQAVRPDFSVTSDNAPAVAEICVRLDGLPLAIELAAARVRLFPPQALLSRLESRLRLLTGGARDLPARQRTLQGAIDWSYDLLNPDDRILFARLSVFAGGCTLEAAEQICDPDGEVDVLTGVESLVEQSLLRRDEDAGGEMRLSMLGTIREYAANRLEEGGVSEELRRSHATYYAEMALAVEQEFRGPGHATWVRRLAADHDNLRAALAWALGGNDPELALRIAAAAWRFWTIYGYMAEGRGWLERALAHADAEPTAARAKALIGLGRVLAEQGEYEEATARLEEALAMSREVGERAISAHALGQLAVVANYRGRYESSVPLYEQSLQLYREVGDQWGVAAALTGLGLVALSRGDYSAAEPLLEESLATVRRLKSDRDISIVLNNLSLVATHLGDYARAEALQRESLALCLSMGDNEGVYASLDRFGTIAQHRGQYQRAARLLAASVNVLEEIGRARPEEERPGHEQQLAALRSELGDEAFNLAWSEGRAMVADQAVEYALRGAD